MKTFPLYIGRRYVLFAVVISTVVALLIHFPEVLSLWDRFEQHSLFPDMGFTDVLNEVLFTFVSLIVLFWINAAVFRFNDSATRITLTKIVLSFLLIWVVDNLLGQLFVYLHHRFDIPAIDTMVHHYLHPMRDFIMSCIVTGSCYIFYLIARQQRILVENQQLRTESIANQYEALKNQLNPHMLFNSLNTLQSLIREDAAKASDYTQELSRVLRYTLQGNESRSVRLAEEMVFARAYIFLLKMRYEDNLNFNIRIDERFNDRLVPPMSLQILVENAVKHNEISNRRPLVISIATTSEGDLAVSNPVQPKITATPGTGIGLENLSKRYSLLYHREIAIEKTDGIFRVLLPLIKPVES